MRDKLNTTFLFIWVSLFICESQASVYYVLAVPLHFNSLYFTLYSWVIIVYFTVLLTVTVVALLFFQTRQAGTSNWIIQLPLRVRKRSNRSEEIHASVWAWPYVIVYCTCRGTLKLCWRCKFFKFLKIYLCIKMY